MTTSWHVRAEKLHDIDGVRSVTLAAFDTEQEASLLQNLRDDTVWIPRLSLVAETVGGDIIGHAVFTRCLIDTLPALFLGPVSVLPELQNQGIGSAMIRGGIEQAAMIGEDHLVVVGHASYYPRFGFMRASSFGVSLTIDAPAEAVMAMTLNPNNPVPAGIVHPADCFGI